MPTTPNLAIPYPNAADQPTAGVYAGVAQRWDTVVAGPWVDWSALITISQSSSLTKTVQYAKYRTWGKHCEFKFKVTLGAAGTAGQLVTIGGLPVNNKFTTARKPSGFAHLFATTPVLCALMHNSSATNMILTPSAGATDTYTTALANTDVLYGWGGFEVA